MSRIPLAEIISHSAARAAKSSEVEMPWNGNTERAYLRTLPGGGYVAIDVSYVRRVFRRGHYRGVVLVERRADGDRHRTFAPIIIARATGRTIDSVVH